MKENGEERHARETLEAFGFRVTQIPPAAGRKRADYRAMKGEEELVIEVTGKRETHFIDGLRHQAAAEGLSTGDRVVAFSNGIDALVKRKAKQLAATPAAPTTLRILWIAARHQDGDYIAKAVRATVFGLSDVMIHAYPAIPETRPCFYYNLNSFHSVPNIDGIVLATLSGGQLLLNEFSPRADRFRASSLTQSFGHATIDPVRMAREASALRIEGPDVDRRDQKAKWRYLWQRYGLKTTASTLHQFVGFATISVKDLQ